MKLHETVFHGIFFIVLWFFIVFNQSVHRYLTEASCFSGILSVICLCNSKLKYQNTAMCHILNLLYIGADLEL